MRVLCHWALASTIAGLLFAGACGGTLPPPKRRVLEEDVGGWRFRRYQHVVDVEVYLEGNPAVAHTASYVRDEAERRGRLGEGDVASAFVTEYRYEKGVARALVRFARRLAQEAGYQVEEERIGGQRVFRVVGPGESWAFWASGRYVVKIGGRGLEKVPSSLVSAYGRRYPSQLRDGALDGPIEDEGDEDGR